ncbi:MAG: YggS family pyridoxal phosphate-dependent enzyme [Spirochaetales bacterium]|nr:YggS family pyridoxal phosphate-dependent enzyme [Spirochaetales bacterium]
MIGENLKKIYTEIKEYSHGKTKLMAVSKTYPAEAVREAQDAGQILFGENRAIEARDKFQNEIVTALPFDLHIIGHLQRNKVKDAIKVASMIESIDKLETLQELEKQCAKVNKKIEYLIEINSSLEEQKSGVYPPQFEEFVEQVLNAGFSFCKLRGVMTVGPLTDDAQKIRNAFAGVRRQFELLQKTTTDIDILSMGMSSDYRIAIDEGSTQVRVGSAIFGRRNYN